MSNSDWKEVSVFDEPQESYGFLFWKVATSWRYEIEQALESEQLTQFQFVMMASLAWLTRNGDATTLEQHAQMCEIPEDMILKELKVLQGMGLLTLSGSSIELTPEGIEKAQKTIPIVEEVDKSFFGSIQTEGNPFMRFMKKINQMD